MCVCMSVYTCVYFVYEGVPVTVFLCLSVCLSVWTMYVSVCMCVNVCGLCVKVTLCLSLSVSVYMWMYVCVYHMCESALRGLRRVSDSLELGLQML